MTPAQREAVADAVLYLDAMHPAIVPAAPVIAALLRELAQAPTPRPLTDEQIAQLVEETYRRCGHMTPTPLIIVRAIEAALGITGDAA